MLHCPKRWFWWGEKGEKGEETGRGGGGGAGLGLAKISGRSDLSNYPWF